MKDKEAIYDAEISPLMIKIIEVCKREGVCMICSFDIGNDGDPTLNCLSRTPDENDEVSEHHANAYQAIRGESHAPAMKITTVRADGSVASQEVIVSACSDKDGA